MFHLSVYMINCTYTHTYIPTLGPTCPSTQYLYMYTHTYVQQVPVVLTCIHIYIHTCTLTHIYIHACTYAHIHTYLHQVPVTHVWRQIVNKYVCPTRALSVCFPCPTLCESVCVCMYVCAYVCAYVYVCMYLVLVRKTLATPGPLAYALPHFVQMCACFSAKAICF